MNCKKRGTTLSDYGASVEIFKNTVVIVLECVKCSAKLGVIIQKEALLPIETTNELIEDEGDELPNNIKKQAAKPRFRVLARKYGWEFFKQGFAPYCGHIGYDGEKSECCKAFISERPNLK